MTIPSKKKIAVLVAGLLCGGSSALLSTTKSSSHQSALSYRASGALIRLDATVHDFNYLSTSQDLEPASLTLPTRDELLSRQSWQKELTPLSLDPILCVSTEPILSPHECRVLKNWCLDQLLADEGSGISIREHHLEQSATSEGTRILRKLQNRLSDLLALDADDEHRHALPRYLYYPSGNQDAPFPPHTESIVPDGLHVDSNNGKYLRHWTVLLYLNSCETSGATTFPLASPFSMQKNSFEHNNPPNDVQLASTKGLPKDRHGEIVSYLINEKDVHHTREWMTKNKTDVKGLCDQVEQTAVDLYSRQRIHRTGARILPQQGHITIFSTLQHDGYTNPKSIHAGEAMARSESKDVLTFFYEVPQRYVHDRQTLGDQVARRDRRFRERHGI